jgi:hypothetical protein
MGEFLLTSGRDEEAATRLMEGFFMTGDRQFQILLLSLYRGIHDAKHCAVLQTPNGPVLNNACEEVHSDICKASVDLTQFLNSTSRQGIADEIKNRALGIFGCPTGMFGQIGTQSESH